MKRPRLYIGIALLLGLSLLMVGPAFATTEEEEPAVLEEGILDQLERPQNEFMDDVKSAILAEAGSGRVLMARDADSKRSVAGLIKLPAVLVLCEAVDSGAFTLDSEVSVSRRAGGIGGPSAFIEAGEIISAKHLMKAAVMICAGDAILALGENAFGSETAFVDSIQERLQGLGIKTAYDDGVGKGCTLSAKELATLGGALMQSPCFTAHSKLTYELFNHADGRETEIVNANRMLRDYAGSQGVATGSSSSDGYCGVFSVLRGDTHLICVVTGAENSAKRFETARSMMEEAFVSKRAQRLCTKGEVLAEGVRVHGGKSPSINLVAKDTVVLLLEKSDPALTPVKEIPESVSAPLTTSDIVGSISYRTAQGVEMGRVELVAQSAVEESLLRDCIRSVLLTFLRR